MPKKLELVGKRFKRLTVNSFAYIKKGCTFWFCKCDCGNMVVVKGAYLMKGDTKSCGCLNIDIIRQKNEIHKMSKTKFYDIWIALRKRCENSKDQYYKNYGGRGIKVEWRDFQEFMADMYESYLNHIALHGHKNTCIDRINNDGNYHKENCRWTTRLISGRNTRRIVFIEFNGITKSLTEWACIYNIPAQNIQRRLQKGWPKHLALMLPTQKPFCRPKFNNL